VKFYEEKVKYPATTDPYYPFTINYDKELKLSDEKYSPTFYLLYNFVSDDYFDTETKIILLHGYDNKRYFIPINQATLVQFVYRVNKALLLSHLIHEDYIFKTEFSYSDVISDDKMSDYIQCSFGVERNFYDIKSGDLGMYVEYYRYIYMQDNKIKNVDISEIYDNDIFMALKLNLNDVKSTELKGGLLYDTQNSEQIYKAEFKSRVFDDFVLRGEYLQTIGKQNTLLTNTGDTKRFTLGVTYSF